MAELIDVFEEQGNVIIVGKKRVGKTLLGWLLALKFAKHSRAIYVYRFPKPELLKTLPFKVTNIIETSQITNLTNAILLVDEAHRVFPVSEKRVNGQFRDILSTSGQSNLCVVLICHNSYFINRSLFSFIDIKCIKETNEGHWELERPYMKKLYQDILIKGKNKFYLDSEEVKGIQTYGCPDWYTNEMSKCYARTKAEEEEDFFNDVKKCEMRTKIPKGKNPRYKHKYGDRRRWYGKKM